MDSECFSCSDFSLLSEDENSKKIYKLKQKNQKLNILNQDLISKNKILNEQIERALKMNSNIEETFQKHNETVKELISVKAEKDDLENRLRLSLLANDELKIHIRKICNENSVSINQDNLSPIKGQNSQIDFLKKQIVALEKHNSELSEQIIEIAQSQERSNNNTQIPKQSSETFDNILLSPTQNQRSIIENEEISSNISLRNERDKMMNLLNRQNDLTTNLELKLKKANEEIEELREKNRNLTKDVMKKGQISDSNELTIPDSVFSSAEFPLDLENMVSGIYKNPNLSITTKIRQIISVVTHYFKSKYEQIERDLKESKDNTYKLTEKTNSLIDFLHRIFPSSNINYNALLDDESARNSLKDSIDKLKNDLITAQQEKEQLEHQYEDIAKQMKTNSYQELTNSIANLQMEHKEFKQFKKDTKSKEEEFTKTIKELETANQILEDNIGRQKSKTKLLKIDFENQMKRTIEENQQEIQKLKNDNANEIARIKSETENSINNLNQKHTNQIDELNNKLQAKTQEIDELKQQNNSMKNELSEMTKLNNDQLNGFNTQKDALSQELEKCKYVIKQLRLRKEKREKEIDFLKQQNSDNEKEIRDKLKNQKNEIQIRIEQIQQLRSKEAKEYSQTISNLKIEIEQLIKERNELLAKNTNLSINLQKLETKFNALTADRERERREFDSKMTAQRNACQSEITTKTNELKSEFIELKNQLYQSFIKQLGPLLNFGSSLNESNMNSLILEVRKKIETNLAREAKIREILKINAFESIEEALANRINHSSKRKRTRIEL